MSQVHLVLYFNAISRASTPRLLARFLSLHARNFQYFRYHYINNRDRSFTTILSFVTSTKREFEMRFVET